MTTSCIPLIAVCFSLSHAAAVPAPALANTVDIPAGWTGPKFELSNVHPASIPPGDPKPWKSFDFKTHTEEYIRAVLAYCREGNEADWVGQNNAVRKWYRAPGLVDYSLQLGIGESNFPGKKDGAAKFADEIAADFNFRAGEDEQDAKTPKQPKDAKDSKGQKETKDAKEKVAKAQEDEKDQKDAKGGKQAMGSNEAPAPPPQPKDYTMTLLIVGGCILAVILLALIVIRMKRTPPATTTT